MQLRFSTFWGALILSSDLWVPACTTGGGLCVKCSKHPSPPTHSSRLHVAQSLWRSYVHNLFLHFCKRLFPVFNPWPHSHKASFTAALTWEYYQCFKDSKGPTVQEIPLVMLLQVIDSSGGFFLVATNASNDQLSLHILRWGWGNPNSKKKWLHIL
jgi:hypothetical protein